MALKFKWHKQVITDVAEAKEAFRILRIQKPKYFGFDTETTGLNIYLDKPFFFQFGWLNTEPNKNNKIDELYGYSFAVDLELTPELALRVIRSWNNYLLSRADDDILYIGQNIKFDLHQTANIGMLIDEKVPITELQFWIRYAHDSLQVNKGGPPLKLKDYSVRYLDRSARLQDVYLQQERSRIASGFNADLRLKIKEAGCEVPSHLKHVAKSVTATVLNEMFKDPIFDIDMLPDDIREVYIRWKEDLPDWIRHTVVDLVESDNIPYHKLNRVILSRYALDDIVWTLEAFWQCKPIAEKRNNVKAIYEIENPSLWPVWHMERTGFKIDKEYLEESRLRLREYILQQRERLFNATQVKFKVGQHVFIKRLLQEDFGLDIASTNAAYMKGIISDLERSGENPKAVEVVKLIQELRTLEKWYSAYILRFKYNLDAYDSDKIWTQFNTVGAVSGRFTSDMHQFPNDGIMSDLGEELFNPRKMVIVPKDEGFTGMSIIDFANEEMRFQAMYTILCGNPDLNLCRAFMPYECHRKDGTKFNYENKTHLKEWDSKDWYYNENPEELWNPTDLHSAMTIGCGFDRDYCRSELGDKATEEDVTKLFRHYRNTIGKPLNFMKAYGGGLKRVVEMFPKFSLDKCKEINGAYYKTFPGLKTYHQYCEYLTNTQEYAENLFHTKYYNISAHNCKNMLIQGSCASFLKIKLRQLYDFIKENKLKSVLLAAIHDEVDFYIWPGEEHYIEDFQRIMETWEDGLVPILADPDYGTESWALTKDQSYYKWKESVVNG